MISTGVVDYSYSGTGFIQFAATGALVTALVIAVLYVVNIPDTVTFFPWSLVSGVARVGGGALSLS